MTEAKRISYARSIDTLQGSLSDAAVPDLLQLIQVGGRTGQFRVRRSPDGLEARMYFAQGELVHAAVGDDRGLSAIAEVLGWEHGGFQFSSGVLSPERTISLPLQNALLEAARLNDERESEPLATPLAGNGSAASQQQPTTKGAETVRSSTDVLEDCLKVPGVSSAVVIGRDGFLIESVGGSKSVNVETLGASLAHAINGIEEMGSELDVLSFADMFVEYGRAVIMCRPVGGAIIAVVAPDASKLGIIRHKITPLVSELASHF